MSCNTAACMVTFGTLGGRILIKAVVRGGNSQRFCLLAFYRQKFPKSKFLGSAKLHFLFFDIFVRTTIRSTSIICKDLRFEENKKGNSEEKI